MGNSTSKNHRVCIYSVLVLVLLVTAVSAQEQEEPRDVYIGTYVNRIYDVSLKDNRFTIDFYVWFRWQGNDIKPQESFEVVNGTIESIDGLYEDVIDEYNYASCRVIATITKFWDVSQFPLDGHILTLEIEDTDNEEFKMRYIADQENCALNPEVQVPGWTVSRHWSEVIPHEYETNYGDISLPTNNVSVYSRYIHAVQVERPNIGYFIKLFFGVFIAALIAFLAFFIKPTDLDPRFGVGIGAIFAAVASEYVITSSLPDTNIMTLADKLHIIAFAFIFLSLAQSTLSLKLFSTGKEKLSQTLDIMSFYIFMISYIVISGLVTLLR
jgi:hypothetical protein